MEEAWVRVNMDGLAPLLMTSKILLFTDEITTRIALLRTKAVKHRHDDQRSYRHPSQYKPLITPWLGRSVIGWVAHPRSLESHTPSPRPLKERLEFLTEQASNEGRTSSRDRRSALARIAEPDLCGNPLVRASVRFDSGRLQDVEILYDGVINQEQNFSTEFSPLSLWTKTVGKRKVTNALGKKREEKSLPRKLIYLVIRPVSSIPLIIVDRAAEGLIL
ncbi:hypothetical protein YC2023_099129 [Brassica napus]